MNTTETAKFGHHPDPMTDAEVEIDRLVGLLATARAALERALDYNAVTPNGVSIKRNIRWALQEIGEQP